jgi:antitoxin HicB
MKNDNRFVSPVKGEANWRTKLMPTYTVILEPNYPEEGYTIRVPALPGCISYGRKRQEALNRAKEAIQGFIEGLEKAGETVPVEVTPVETDTITV